MSLNPVRRALAVAPLCGRRSVSRALLAAAAIVLAAGSSSSAFAQATGDAPAAPQAADQEAPATQGAPAPPPPGPRDGTVLQDWTLRCQMADAERELCEMRQRIVDQNGNRVVLAVVGRLPNSDTPGLLILLPLGIALPPGTALRIDQGEVRPVEVERCERQGCRIELLLDEGLLPLFKAGSRAVISFHVYDGQGDRPEVDVPISLLGFSAALAEVMR